MTDAEPRKFAPRGPAEVAKFLDVKAQELSQLERDLQEAHEVAEAAEERWTEHRDEVMIQLEEEAEGGGPKVPGEDRVTSIARRRGGAEAWTNHRRAERAVKRIEKQATIASTAISACQSEARLLRATA